jgi:hypothetical protein
MILAGGCRPPKTSAQRRPANPSTNKPSMKITNNRGMLVLAIYLILAGLIGLFGIRLGQLSFVLPLLAIVAGILILIEK